MRRHSRLLKIASMTMLAAGALNFVQSLLWLTPMSLNSYQKGIEEMGEDQLKKSQRVRGRAQEVSALPRLGKDLDLYEMKVYVNLIADVIGMMLALARVRVVADGALPRPSSSLESDG